MTSLLLLAILVVFIVCAYGLNRERGRLNKDQKAQLIDVQSSPKYLLAMGLMIAGLLFLPYVPTTLFHAFIGWIVFSVIIGAWSLRTFYHELKNLNFPVAYLKTVIIYSAIMIFLGVAFLLAAGFVAKLGLGQIFKTSSLYTR